MRLPPVRCEKMNVTVFEAINITKKYRNTLALNQVSMSVMQGDIYGFIGENGAGKTTMIRLLTGLAEPTTGKIALFGESNKKLAKQRERIGCIIESPSLYLDMTAYENLEVQRLQRGIPGKGCIDNALALVGLKDTGKKKAKDFSLGMRQRLALAIALLGNPEFLVLDEPINGLDPTGIIELRNLLKRLNKERGITILISSHILTELHQLANRYGILHEGKLLQEITATELDKRCKKHLLLQVNDTGTIKLSVAYGTKRTILYYTKAITILVVSLITYLIFVATFFVIEIIQSGYIPTASEVINLLGWALACGTVLLALESISIFLCVVIQNTGIVTGICCLYVFSGASVYLMLWSDMETVSIPLKFFVYGNPMYYWMNFSSCRTMGIIEHLPFYFIGCISLLIVGGLIMIRKEIK